MNQPYRKIPDLSPGWGFPHQWKRKWILGRQKQSVPSLQEMDFQAEETVWAKFQKWEMARIVWCKI